MKRGLRNFVLISTHIIFSIPFRFLFRISGNGKKVVISKEKNYIIAANHPSKIDPYLILASLPLKTFVKLIPIAFLITEDYLKKWNYKPFLLMWGCVSDKKKKRIKPLQRLKEKLEENENVFIFPRGELEKKGEPSSPKVGVVYLEREVQSAYILPVKVELQNKITLSNVLRRKVKVKITFKEDFRHRKFKKDLQPLANDVIKKILD